MTVAEAQRRRVLHALVLVVILIMASLSLIRYLSPAEQARMVKDSGLTAITVFGMIVSIFVVSFMIPHEIESRTIYPVLAKPVRRYEFLLGKYVGALVILGAVMASLTVVLVGFLALEAHFVPPIGDSVFDPSLPGVIAASAMTYAALGVLTTLIMLISSMASTTMAVDRRGLPLVPGQLAGLLPRIGHQDDRHSLFPAEDLCQRGTAAAELRLPSQRP